VPAGRVAARDRARAAAGVCIAEFILFFRLNKGFPFDVYACGYCVLLPATVPIFTV